MKTTLWVYAAAMMFSPHGWEDEDIDELDDIAATQADERDKEHQDLWKSSPWN